MLHANQQRALEISQANDYASGIHSHATGTGKSWIALELINRFRESRSPKPVLIVWICEQKFILQDQFAADTISTKGYAHVLNKFLVHDFATKKAADWAQLVDQASIWKRSQLVIINRAFLSSQDRYKGLHSNIDLIIHDECHSISNKSTRDFYTHILKTQGAANTRVIGFSATPYTEYEPLTKVHSYYSIADAVQDKVILPPKIHWLKSHTVVTDQDIKNSLKLILALQPYKKVIVWCGMIERCFQAAAEWSTEFTDYLIAVDTSHGAAEFATYDQFAATPEKALLFCAAKHREGSDIANLDTCVFLDRVENRNAKTFVQCVGRVLRRDPERRKKYGVILDVSAASSIKVCDRINEYLNPSMNYFPFIYNMKSFPPLQIHTLQMVTKVPAPLPLLTADDHVDLPAHFVRAVPDEAVYKDRLAMELELIMSKRLGHYLLQAVEILKITAGIPHVTRGSCGSSLVVYLLGISHVDPVKYGISFARFLTEFRDTLPDIDFDFPYNLRDEVFLQLQQRWPNRLARISNHIHYHDKSAIRQAAREAGLKGNMSTLEIMNRMRGLSPKVRQQIAARQKELNNTFRTYSLHCGGIIFYPDGVPAELKLNNRTIPQVKLDKRNVAAEKHFKIDILSSRALAILYECMDYKHINFEEWEYDEATADLFCSGDNIGIILGESPLIRKAFRHFQPRSLDDVAICLAIIRPAARDAKTAVTTADLTAKRVYDDDAITLIAGALNCSEAEADRWRRGLTKEDPKVMNEFAAAIQGLRRAAREELVKQLQGLRDYSFCKAHAYSYAQLVWKLAWCKAHKPREFWAAVMKHADSYYRRWVHVYEARLAGVNVEYKGHASIYAQARRRAAIAVESPIEILRKKGVWQGVAFFPNCYYVETASGCKYNGIIASVRVIGYNKVKTAVVCLGVGPKMYIEVLIQSRRLSLAGKVGMKGVGATVDKKCYISKEREFYLY